MAEQNLLKTPLNAPNQEADLGVDTKFEGWGTPTIAPTAPEPVQPVQAIPETLPQPEIIQEAPTVVEQKLATVGQAVQAKAHTFAEDHEQRRLAQVEKVNANNLDTAWASDVDTVSGGAINVAANLTAGATRVLGNIVQFIPSGVMDDYADTAEIREVMAKETELKQRLADSVDPVEQEKLSARIDYISNWLDTNYEEDFSTDVRLISRRQETQKAADRIDTATAVYDLVEGVDAYFDSTINKSLSNAITEEVKPYAQESAAQFKNGDYVAGLSTLAEGIFTVAISNPQGAVEMFSNSLPQMIAVASKLPISAATVVATYSEHVDAMAADFEESYGQRATDEDREAIQLGAAAATMFDFFSDKVALKGMDLIPTKMINKITEGMVKLAPNGTKTVTKYTTKIAGNVGGLALQPVQEFVSGAGTELSEQVGVHKGVGDLETVLEQGIIEAVAVSPVQGVVAAKDVLKGAKTVAKDTSAAEKSSKVVASVKKSAGDALTKINDTRLAKRVGPDSLVFKAIKFSQEGAESIDGTPEESTKYAETLGDMIEAASLDIAANPDKSSPELLNEFQILLDIQGKIQADVAKKQEQGAGINMDDLAIEIETTVKKGMIAALSPESRAKLKGGVLYSMQTDDIVTEEQAKTFINEFSPSKEERAIAISYLKRLKSMKEVGSDVLNGEGQLFVGAKTYARTIQAAVLSGDLVGAAKNLVKFTQFSDYMKVKATTFNSVWQYNRNIASKKTDQKIPAGINIVSQDESGRITEFTLTDTAKYGVGVDGVGKVWNSANDGQIRALANQVTKENKVIASYLAQTSESVNSPSTDTEAQSTTEDEYLNGSVPTAPAPLSQEEIDSMDDGSTESQSPDVYEGAPWEGEGETRTVYDLKGNKIVATVVETSKQGTQIITIEGVEGTHILDNSDYVTTNSTDLGYALKSPNIGGATGSTISGLKLAHLIKLKKALEKRFAENKGVTPQGGTRSVEQDLNAINAELGRRDTSSKAEVVVEEAKSEPIATLRAPVVENKNSSTAKPVSIASLGKEAITLNSVIEGMKESQKKAKNPASYDARITTLEAELQVIIDAAATKEAARLADPKTALEVYDLSKSILTDTEVDLDYLNDLYQEDVEAEYVQSTIWPTSEEKASEVGRTMESVLEPKSSKEIQSEEDIKETLESRNLFKTVRNFFKAFKKNPAFLKMNKAELATVSTLAEFNAKFTAASIYIIAGLSNNLDKDNVSTVHKEGTDRFQENPMNYLLKMISVNGVTTGYLDPNILSIMAMSGMDYLATMGSSTIYNDDSDVKALLGIDSNAQVSAAALRPFRRVGTTKAAMADIIGAMVFKQLGLKGTALADETLEAQMITALGLTTIDIMSKMGLLTQSSKPRNELDILNPDAAVVPELVNFVRIAVTKKDGKDAVVESVRNYIDNYSLKDGSQEAALSTILDTLFGITSAKKFPLLKPRKIRKGATYLRSDVKIPASVIKDIEYAQSVEWRFKPAIAALLSGTDREATIQALKDISGFKSDLSEVPTYFLEKAEADNDTILREITDTLTFFDMMALSGQDQFHYSYNSWNNSRHGMAESAVSPQSSKLIRHLIYPTDPTTGESFSEELSMSDPVHMQMFKVAIAQTLLTEVAIDKDTLAAVNEEFERVIGTGKPIRKNPIAIAGREVRDGGNPVTVAAKYGLEDTISVDGLVALGEYYKALKSKSDTFTVNIAIETDATTSGLIISFLNTGLRSEGALKKLAAGGVYTDRTNYVEHNQVNPDNYQMLANVWADKIKLSDAFVKGHAEDVVALLGMPSRADAKDPVLQHNYFAGVKTLVSSYVESSLDKLYEGLTSPDERVRKEALHHINNVMAFDNKLLGKPKSFKQSKVVDKGIHTELTKWQQIKFQVVVRAVYGQAMEDGLAELGNEFANYGESLNEAGNTAYYVYKALQESLEKGLMEARNQDYMSNEMRDLVNNDPTLVALYPRMKFFDTGDGVGIHAFKKNSERNTDAGSRVVTRYPDGRPFNGTKSTSARTSTVNDNAPGVSLVARSIQGMDDVSARSVFGQFPVMHLFDAVFSTVLNTIRNTKEYNTATLEANRDFSIYDNAVLMLQNIVDTLEKNPAAAAIVAKEVLNDQSPLFELDFKSMLKSALKTQKKIQENKALLFSEDIVHVDHAGLEGTGIINEENINEQATESGVDALVEQFLGSTLGADAASQVDHTNFVHSDSETLSAENALDIFDTLGVADRKGNSTDTAEHLTHLRTLLADVIAPALTKLGDFSLRMRRAGDTNAGSIHDNEILLNFGVNNGSNVILNQGSERTTYVHELVHAITRFMFDDPKMSNTATEIVKLRERARKHLTEKYKGEPWRVFLSEDDSVAGHVYNRNAEIAHAKGTYEYIFEQKGEFYTAGNADKISARGIHEFVTFGLTDPRLTTELANMPYRSARDTAKTIGGRIQNVFLELIDRIIDRVKHRGDRADTALIQLVAALNKVDTKTRFNTNFIMKGIGKIDDVAALKITEWVFTPIARLSLAAQNVRSDNLIGKTVRVAASVVGAVNPVQELPAGDTGAIMQLPFRKALDESRKRLRISKNSLLVHILRTIAGPSNDMDRKVEHMLAKSNMLIDQNRKNIIEGTRKHIEESFRTTMEKQDWEALTLSVLKTDLVSLFPNLTAEEIPKFIDILRNTKGVRKNKIAEIRAKLATYGVIGDHYIQQSKGLGLFMAKGEVTVRMQRMNAYMIANSKDVVPPKSMPKDLVAVEGLIDQLASLYAIENTDSGVNANTAAIFEREMGSNPRKNGIIEFLGLAVSAKQDALSKNFNNDKTHTVKGHIKSITNPNISVKIALLSEKKKMKEMGYKLVAALQDDTVSDPSKDHKALYSSDFVTMQDYNRGIISTTSMRASGTLLSQMLANSTGEMYNFASAKKAVKAAVLSNNKEARKHVGNPDHAITEESVMVPVFDTNQNIVDFRYMMTDHTKLSVLKQELRSNVVLSALIGSIADKVQTTVVNEEALVMMKKDFDDNFLKKSDEFIKISLSSGKAKHRELYNMLPEQTKMLIKKVFGNNELHVDEKYIDILFGQRSLSLADLPFLNHRIVKIAEVIWKEMVSMAKKNIVIKTGSVLYHNILSNTVVGILNGVPIEYMIKEQLRTARDLNAYMTVKRDLYATKAELKAAVSLNDTKGISEAQDTIRSFQTVLNNSPVRELIRRGMFQSITEEIDTESDPYSYASALSGKINKFAGKNKTLSKVNAGAQAVGRYTYMTDDTSMYKLLLKTTQYSDFVARQAVFKYKTEVEGIGKDETENLVRDLFVNYDLPDHQIIQYMNETGISMFTKYPMRMLRVIFKMMKGRPVEGIMLILLEDFIGFNIDDPTDIGLNILNSPFGIVEDAFTQSGVEMARNIF